MNYRGFRARVVVINNHRLQIRLQILNDVLHHHHHHLIKNDEFSNHYHHFFKYSYTNAFYVIIHLQTEDRHRRTRGPVHVISVT